MPAGLVRPDQGRSIFSEEGWARVVDHKETTPRVGWVGAERRPSGDGSAIAFRERCRAVT